MIVKLRALLLRWTLPRCVVCGRITEDRRKFACSAECDQEMGREQALGF